MTIGSISADVGVISTEIQVNKCLVEKKSKSRTTVAFGRSQILGMSVNAVGGDVCRMREEDVQALIPIVLVCVNATRLLVAKGSGDRFCSGGGCGSNQW